MRGGLPKIPSRRPGMLLQQAEQHATCWVPQLTTASLPPACRPGPESGCVEGCEDPLFPCNPETCGCECSKWSNWGARKKVEAAAADIFALSCMLARSHGRMQGGVARPLHTSKATPETSLIPTHFPPLDQCSDVMTCQAGCPYSYEPCNPPTCTCECDLGK